MTDVELVTDLMQRVEEDRLRRLAVDLAAIDREAKRYHRKLDGLEPWTDFEALVPAEIETRPA